jgi:hypothetical protein
MFERKVFNILPAAAIALTGIVSKDTQAQQESLLRDPVWCDSAFHYIEHRYGSQDTTLHSQSLPDVDNILLPPPITMVIPSLEITSNLECRYNSLVFAGKIEDETYGLYSFNPSTVKLEQLVILDGYVQEVGIHPNGKIGFRVDNEIWEYTPETHELFHVPTGDYSPISGPVYLDDGSMTFVNHFGRKKWNGVIMSPTGELTEMQEYSDSIESCLKGMLLYRTSDIYRTNSAMTDTFNLTQGHFVDIDNVACSPLGNQIAFRARTNDLIDTGLFVINRDGSSPRLIHSGDEYDQMAWDETGNFIGYSTSDTFKVIHIK